MYRLYFIVYKGSVDSHVDSKVADVDRPRPTNIGHFQTNDHFTLITLVGFTMESNVKNVLKLKVSLLTSNMTFKSGL